MAKTDEGVKIRRTIEQKRFYYNQPRLYTRMIQQLETTEERVAWLLQRNTHLRNCDRCLIHTYWEQVESNCKHHNKTPAETITRCRRHIQNTLELFPPTDEFVCKARGIKEKAVKAFVEENK